MFCQADVWEDLISPDNPLTIQNNFEKPYSLLGRNIATNGTLNLGRFFSREQINSVIHTIYKDINSGKISYTLTGLVPVKNWRATGSSTTGSVSSAYNGNRAIKSTTMPTGMNPGTATISEFLDKVFYPFVSATISLNISSSLLEIGNSVTINCNGSVTANDETVFSSAYVSSTTGANMPFTAQAGAYSVQQANVVATTSFRSYITTGSSGVINSPLRTVTFVYPYFWSMNANDLTAGGTAFYSGITKRIQTQGTKTPIFNGSAQYIYFAFPSEYPDLTSIKDQNGFEVLGSFTKYEVSVTSTGLDTDWTHNYKIYRCNGLTTVNNGQYTFTH